MTAERTWDELVQLNERMEYGEAWLPDKHDNQPTTLVGTVAGYNQGPESEWSGDKPWICTVADRDGKLWSIWLNRAVLMSEFERHRPMPDDRIVIRYRGQAPKANRAGAAPAHLYTLTVDGEQRLPGFLTRPELEEPEGERRRDLERTGESDIPADPDVFTYGEPPAQGAADVSDAEVVEDKQPENEGDDDEPIPF